MSRQQRETLVGIASNEASVKRVVRWIAASGALVAVIIGLRSLLLDHLVHAAVLFGFAASMLANEFILFFSKDDELYKSFFLWSIGLLLLYLAASGGESNTGILWCYVFPPFVFYISGLKTGLSLVTALMLGMLLIFNFENLSFVLATYSPDFQIRFFSTIMFVVVFSYIVDKQRRDAITQLVTIGKLYEYAARTDELTKLPNRRDMRDQLETEFSRYQRNGHHFSVILLDIDHFKQINDNYGHDAGDVVLTKFADALRDICRKMDTAARWGGEEFLILLPDTKLLEALAMAERLRIKISRMEVAYGQQTIRLTTSCGVCSIHSAKDLGALLRQADVSLYQAKLRGRNIVIPQVTRERPATAGLNNSARKGQTMGLELNGFDDPV
ncbi:GGDEF domain-containing protein [Allohahella sp. A8]|uniref:GGDEF domain-containing protein n=1 Tax=Allohahella sp. A8 TaxID=3141461 RepID=UPI000C09527C|nr:GGDEF domain-containing protein [Hahellaceae bacterium]|tara:strand:+ start:67844 stop:68998 length:1155 start_codon:yes stop_codon:yes gene_type:complete